METTKSIEIIDQMLQESRKSLYRNSFYFILWGLLLIPAGIYDFVRFGSEFSWIMWPILSIIGGTASSIYSRKEDKRAGAQTIGDRITLYTWAAFGFTMIISIIYAIYNHLSPYPLVLILSGSATFISGGISKFKPFIFGGIVLEIGAIICAFIVDPSYHGLVFVFSLIPGYVIPGFILRKIENVEA